LSINQRNLENFSEWPIIKNSIADENCVNCHSYNNGKTDDFLFHMRGSLGGTFFYSGGKLKKMNLKTKEMKNGAVYPRWHPSGKYVAFSVNKIVQQFHSADNKKIEVSDLESSLVLYDIEKNEMLPVRFPESEQFMDTYPEWSPDGTFLYFCRARQIGKTYDYRQIRYNLYRVPFDPVSRRFGNAELIYDADSTGKSISFPRISPSGKYLVMTMQDYGCFPIWHKETDLWSFNLSSLKAKKLDLNSEFSDSYHSWSSNSRWLVFSSKRDDGLTTRPYIAYIDENGNSGKPFLIPRKNPDFYNGYLKSFNVPEFSGTKIRFRPGKIYRSSRDESVPASWTAK
jgi:Tol biopolymer transport system component